MKNSLINFGHKVRRSILNKLTLFVLLFYSNAGAYAAKILWTQYCQHQGTMKLLVHMDADPTSPVPAKPESVKLWIDESLNGNWKIVDEQPIDYLTATVLFELEEWPRYKSIPFKVDSGEFDWEGLFRAEPMEGSILKAVGLSCHRDIGWPWKEAISEVISHDPDLVIFTGDQIYENDYDSPKFLAKTKKEVPKGMKNYLYKYRKFGEAFHELMRDRPTIMITDDHDVFLSDLWGNGAALIESKRTSGGYPAHPDWVNAAEFTQTGHLPDPVNPGPHGAGIKSYYTSLEYGGVQFAILEDRKWKSPPSKVLKKQIIPRGVELPKKLRNHTGIEVVLDPDFDCTKLDDAQLHLLGTDQEEFLADWSNGLKESGQIGAVISASPWIHVAMYSATFADLDSNAWPQSARNRALRAIGDAPVVMLHGDVHLGTLGRHGVDEFNDGPVTYSFPAFSSPASRVWKPIEKGQNRKPGAPDNTGQFHDRFGNKVTMYGAGNGLNGYGLILFDTEKREIELQFHPMNEERKPIKSEVFGWPYTVRF